MKYKTLKLFLTMGLALSLGLAITACGESTGNAGGADHGTVTLSGRMRTVFGAPDGALGAVGDICLDATTGEIFRKTAEGWEKAEYESCDAKDDAFIVSYSDGSVGTYGMPEGDPDCTHEHLSEPFVVYAPKCVVPGIGVKTCTDCFESFPVILPASGHHTFEGSSDYFCEVCDEYHISTPESMFKFESDVNASSGGATFSGETIYLDADINLGGLEGWKPISATFVGIFEGQGHTITNPGTAVAKLDLDPIVDESGVFAADIDPANIHNLHVEIAVGDIGFTHQFEYGLGEGIVAEDYKVKSADGLRAFRDEVNSGRNSFAGMTVNLTQNIDLEYELFFRIGTNSNGKRFAGTFNGNGFEIQNVKVASSSDETAAQTMEIGEVFSTLANGGTASNNCLTADAVLNYTVHNYGDLEQIYTWKDYQNGSATSTNMYSIGGERTWIVNNAEGMKLFRDRVNNLNHGTGSWQYRSYAYDTVKLAKDIDLENEPFVVVNTAFTGVFDSQGHKFLNVATGSVSTNAATSGQTLKSQAFGQVFADYTSGAATIDYEVHNAGDFEQVSVYTKNAGEAMYAEHQWYVNNVDGFKQFASIVNSTYKWNASAAPQSPIQCTFGATATNGKTRITHTIDLMSDIDLKNEPFVVVSANFAGTFKSNGHGFTNVVTGSVSNGETIKSQELGQIFADYSSTGKTAVFDYTVHNEGNFEQVSHYRKEAGEMMYAEHNWYIHNADGLRLFSDITNSHPAWNAADRGDVPIQFAFGPSVTNGETRATHTIHLTDDIDLENVPFVRVNNGFKGIFDGGEYEIKNVFVANSATDLRKVQEWGQVFANNTNSDAVIHYTLRNEGDFEQVSTFSKNKGETVMHDEHNWYIHNADGLRLFSDITNSHPAWNAADRGDVPITFDFAPTIVNGDTRVNHTVHLTCDIDLENRLFVRVANGFKGIFDGGDYVIKNVCPTNSATDLRQGQSWGQVFANNTQANSDIHYTVHNGTDFEQVSTFSKTRGETAMYSEHDWYIRNEAGYAQFAAINGSAYAYNTEGRGDNPIYFEFRTTYSNVNGARVITDSHTVHLMKDLAIGNFDYPNHYLNTSNKDAYRSFGGLFDGGNHTISFTGLARAGIETGRLIPEGNLSKYEKQGDDSYLSVAKIINLKMSLADSELVAKLGGYTAIYNEAGEYDKPIWRIDSVERLTALRDLVSGGRDFKSENLLLVNDFDLKDAAWNPIGTETNPFRGNFDGNHKTVSHFKVSGSSYLGFFSKLDGATVGDLTLANAEITGTSWRVGGLAGSSVGSTITNVVIDTLTVKGSLSGYVGGLVGEGYTGTIMGCTVKGSNVTGGAYMGGISGQGYATINSCTVEDCIITGTSWKAGGIIGQCNEGTRAFNDLIVRRTTLIGSSDNLGAIVGFYNGTSGTVTFNRCQVIECTLVKNSGNLTGAGGFIGEYYSNGTHTATFNDCSVDGLNIEVKNGGINGVGGFIGCDYWRGYTGLTITFNNCSSRMGTVTIADGKSITAFGAFIGDAGVNTVEFVGENFYSDCDNFIGAYSGTVTGQPEKRG